MGNVLKCMSIFLQNYVFTTFNYRFVMLTIRIYTLMLLSVLFLISLSCSNESSTQPEPSYESLGRNGFVSSDSVEYPGGSPVFNTSKNVSMAVSTFEQWNVSSYNITLNGTARVSNVVPGVDVGLMTMSSAEVMPSILQGTNFFLYNQREQVPYGTNPQRIMLGQNTLWKIGQNDKGIPPFEKQFFTLPLFNTIIKGVRLFADRINEVNQQGGLELTWDKTTPDTYVMIDVLYEYSNFGNEGQELPDKKISFSVVIPDTGKYIVPPAILRELPAQGNFLVGLRRSKWEQHQIDDTQIVIRSTSESYLIAKAVPK
jgi:hypothetical protein